MESKSDFLFQMNVKDTFGVPESQIADGTHQKNLKNLKLSKMMHRSKVV